MNSPRVLRERIESLKLQRNALILSHYYQRPEIQDIADFVGDSYGLSLQAAATEADVIVFCGVHFMAESAYILAPDKIVLLPDPEAGCPMADMADVSTLVELKTQHPDAAVVSYVNTTAAVKAESDICCTSANVLEVIKSLPQDKIIYVPDRNMGRYIARNTDKEIILWDGFCNTHDRLQVCEIQAARENHPDAVVMVHPECSQEIVAAADYVTGTGGMLKLARTNPAQTFIVGTEAGLLHALKKAAPGKTFVFPGHDMLCPNMKLNTLEKVCRSLETLEPRITVPSPILELARRSLDRMLDIGG